VMTRTQPARPIAFVLLLLLAVASLPARAQWLPIGPDGGDVRSLAYDPANPDHILLGTSAGQLFSSRDNGASWSRLAHLGENDDYVLDHILFQPSDGVIYVSAWSVEDNTGDIFRSRDGGRTWEALPGMHGKSVRSLAMAASDPRVLVAGALDGVFRSNDGGETWQRISPAGHAEIKNIESLAVDPRNPNVIYAGTWHLPWKTSDGGATWQHIKQGVIDDSDVFSIIIDRNHPQTVYVSACSGIYKSESAGDLFHKVQGIPFSARRTRVLQQDPGNSNVVYAGTTEGLWKTVDAGKTWQRVSAANIIVNDVLVDPRRPSRVLLATDRSGVLASNDGGGSFVASNRGFAHRQVTSLLVDRGDSSVIYAGLVNDKEFGGVYMSRDGGSSWEQRSTGLGSRDVFVLRQIASGDLLAGTNSGVFMLNGNDGAWKPLNEVVGEKTSQVKLARPVKGQRTRTVRSVERSELNARVFDVEEFGGRLYAATSAGLFVSQGSPAEATGRRWTGGPVMGQQFFTTVRATPRMLVAANHHALLVSVDRGVNWYQPKLPHYLTMLNGVAITADGVIWLATREGAFRSSDGGDNWEHVLAGLPHRNLLSITVDEDGGRLLATASDTRDLYESTDSGRSWRRTQTGFALRRVVPVHGRVLATTSYDGIVAQPVASSESRRSAGQTAAGSQEQ